MINIDKLTYAVNKEKLRYFNRFKNYSFYKVDILSRKKLNYIFLKYKPKYVINFAAESHVDNSINKPKDFINSNIIGTYNLLAETRNLYKKKIKTIFVQVSTDEVYGDNFKKKLSSREGDPYEPSSPYSASKASADHLVRAWARTMEFIIKLPAVLIIMDLSNDEKFIPTIIRSLIFGKFLYMKWKAKKLDFCKDNAEAIIQVVLKAKNNSTYNIGINDFTTFFSKKNL